MVRDTRPDGDVVSLRTKSTHRIPVLVDKVTSDLVRFDTTTGGDSTRDLNLRVKLVTRLALGSQTTNQPAEERS